MSVTPISAIPLPMPNPDARTLKPPTRMIGYVDDSPWSYAAVDSLEHVPSLMWPSSISTYAMMRTDPQLSAVLKAYGLLVRHGSWHIDPAGCSDAVVRMVADDIGLPIAGDDTPGSARVRGVSWREHLRLALECLTYGHMGFEMLAEVDDDGLARLTGLSERMPHTISQIHTDKVGEFAGISQDGTAGNPDSPQIKADRVVWYAHEREGASWQGRSLLRPAYGPWLWKREMQTVLATSNRRFGMGVPTVVWDPGSNPTPAQMAEARRAAMAARVGDQSGMTLPPGASLQLIGMSGGTPDTLQYLKWLDQQISGMALARFMDLGSTPNGSRALGESFVDFFVMAVQSLAEDIADTATRQIAARVVDWNWGPTEPVPTVTVGDIGSRHEITAEALQTLLSSGALSADADLEAYVRREWRLPPKPLRRALRPAQPLGTTSPTPGGDTPTVDQPAPPDGGTLPPGGGTTPAAPPGTPPAAAVPAAGPAVSDAVLATSAAIQNDLDWGLGGTQSGAAPTGQQTAAPQ